MSEGLVERKEMGLVLGYAQQQKYWERGVMWLVGMIATAQLGLLPDEITSWSFALGRVRGIYPVNLEDWLTLILQMVLRPFASLTLFGFASFFILGFTKLRGRIVAFAWALLVIKIFIEFKRTHWETYSLNGVSGPIISKFIAAATIAIETYPLMLLALMLRGKKFEDSRLKPSIIWRITAISLVLMATPTVIAWAMNPQGRINVAAANTFAFFVGGSFLTKAWQQTLNGIGSIVGAMACISIFATITWAATKKRKPWRILVICTTLVSVSIVCSTGGYLIADFIWMIENFPSSRTLPDIIRACSRLSSSLENISTSLLFALSARWALTRLQASAGEYDDKFHLVSSDSSEL